MYITSPSRRSLPAGVWLAGGVLLILLLSLWVFQLAMRPTAGDLRLMALFLAITALISGLAAYAASRLGWLERWPTIRLALLGGYILSSLLTFLNVWMTAQLMFSSTHDLQLATVLLFFAGGISVVLGSFLSTAVSERIRGLESAAHNLAEGDLSARVAVKGRDEVAQLARTFNQMAERLQVADQHQREVDVLRRDLIAWVSHDLQTPLASIRAMVEALADGMVQDDETQHRYLETTQREIQALSKLIDDLFQMAQLDAGGLPLEREMNSLSDLLSDVLENFSALAERQGIHLEGQAGPDVDPLWMDARLVERVLNNLVRNALRHTPPGGQVQVHAERLAEQVQVTVSDSGEGIRAEDLPYVFDRFYRGEKSRSHATGGAGLGLAIVRGIVEAHGGQITVTSDPGGGATFRFTLPVTEDRTRTSAPVPGSPAVKKRG